MNLTESQNAALDHATQAEAAANQQDDQQASELYAQAASTEGLDIPLQWQYRNQQALMLADKQLEASRETLQNYGNMSSATILFVLKGLLNKNQSKETQNVCAIAFGPGLTVELCPMQLVAPVVSESEIIEMIESI